MMRCIFIFVFGLGIISCGKSDAIEQSQLLIDKTINRAHNANILRQVNNDKIILKTKSDHDIKILPTIFIKDGQKITEEEFLSVSVDSLFYAEKRMSHSQEYGEMNIKQQNMYIAYSSQYYKQHAFTPKHFELKRDENDQLQLNIKHPVDGDLYVYGFDKHTGKKGIEEFFELNFRGSYSSANRFIDRNIDELRLVVSLADSLYIHDYVIEDFYTHDH